MQMDGDESSNIEDRRGDGGYFGGGGGGYGGMGGIPIPTGGGGGLFKGGLGFVAFIVIALIFGADPLRPAGRRRRPRATSPPRPRPAGPPPASSPSSPPAMPRPSSCRAC